GLLPLRLSADARVAAVMPRPRDLTPADTSSRVSPALAAALREQHPRVDDYITENPPTAAEIAALPALLAGYGLVVLGTIDAWLHPTQAALVEAVIATGVATLTVALRTPFDLAAYPAAATNVCTYGILRPSMDALAAGLFGRAPFLGHLPVAIPGLHGTGDGLTT